ncbi:MAG: OB-fold nucleic acid binding domain-containing protein [Myxococcales bacterium]|nr:OB-fold nucleic acid binding domain-containing protein [Myxococcales bacterium]
MTARIQPIHLLFAGVLVAAGATALVRSSGNKPTVVADEAASNVPQPGVPGVPGPGPAQPLPPGHPAVGGANGGQVPPGGPNHPVPGGGAPAVPVGTVLAGQVLEVLTVTGYTYVRIGEKGSAGGTWAAIPTAKVAVGDPIRVNGQMEMKEFESSALKRKFASLWFGTLDDGSAIAAAGAPPTTAPAPAAPIGSVKVAVAKGGKTISEIIGQRTALAGKTVRLRAVVTKVSNGILGKNYLHLRDGSGSTATADDDLSATTLGTFNVGDTILVEGVIGLDRDIGAGYKFSTILEEAKVVTE